MSNVICYSYGPLCASVCARKGMTHEEVAAEFERERPAGTEAGWQPSKDPTFLTGEPMGCECEQDPGRRHWLLEC